jgi:hypothetical protein
MRSKVDIEKEFIELFNKMAEVQEGQDLTCSYTNCYWNYTQSNNQCVSESLCDFKMKPNSKECKGYWER